MKTLTGSTHDTRHSGCLFARISYYFSLLFLFRERARESETCVRLFVRDFALRLRDTPWLVRCDILATI